MKKNIKNWSFVAKIMSSVGFSVTRDKSEYNTIHKKGKIESEINMKKKYRIITLICLIIVASNLTGCSSIFGKIPNRDEVLEKVSKQVGEDCELVDVETVKGLPRKQIYYFESLERDLKFTVTSTLENVYFESGYMKFFYAKKIKSGYIEAIFNYYKDDIIDKLSEIKNYEKDNEVIVLESEDDYADVVDKIYEADQIYSAERQYHDQKWMNINTVMGIYLDYKIDGKVYEANLITLNGNLSKKEILDKIYEEYEYAQKTRIERTDN